MGMRGYSRPIANILDLRKKLSLSSTALLALPFLLYILYTGIELNFSFKLNLLNHKQSLNNEVNGNGNSNDAARVQITDLTLKGKSSVHAAFIPTGPEDTHLSGSSLFCPYLIQNPVANYKDCYRSPDNFTCMAGPQEGKPIFFGSVGQDHYLWTEHFSFLKRRGVYLDVATNHPYTVSNTFFFDRCLGWRGLCVEANHKYFGKINAFRSCELVPTCVGARDGETVTFVEDVQFGGVVSDSYKHQNRLNEGKRDKLMKTMTCTTVATETRKAHIEIVDFLSLDVEGHEIQVLEGIDWDALKINVILVEVEDDTREKIHGFLKQKGFSHHIPFSHREVRKEGDNPFVSEEIWIASDVVFGNPV